MSWQERLQAAKYQAPSGAEFSFIFTDVSVEFDKKTAVFDFPDVDGSYVQDLGPSGNRYPLQVIFSGENYDLYADAFGEALKERGRGRLTHPSYGTVDVVPFGTVTRTDNLVSGANQATFNVTFFATISGAYPAAQTDGFSQIQSAIALLNVALASDFTEQVNLAKEIDRESFKARFQSFLSKTKTRLASLVTSQKAASDRLNNSYNSINGSIDTLVADPATLVFQTSIFVAAPSLMKQSLGDRLSAYKDLLNNLISGDNKVQPAGKTNNFKNDDLFVASIFSASVASASGSEFTTKDEALSTAADILGNLDEIAVWREANYASLGLIDSSDLYAAMQNLAALAAGYLVEVSFSLAAEHQLTLDRPRNIVELCAELYGSVDDKLDFFINTNRFTGSEIIELPRGRTVTYFK